MATPTTVNSRLALVTGLLFSAAAPAHTVCTLVTDLMAGRVIEQQGDCGTRVTPASTFKIALSLIAYDAGLLKSARVPVLRWKTGDPDWGGAAWHQPTDPERWMGYSVVWYSQRLTRALGMARLQRGVDALDYGKRDLRRSEERRVGKEC